MSTLLRAARPRLRAGASRHPERRYDWFEEQRDRDPKRLVFIDETIIYQRGPWSPLTLSNSRPPKGSIGSTARFNRHRLLEPIDHIPPAEAEANYYAALQPIKMAADFMGVIEPRTPLASGARPCAPSRQRFISPATGLRNSWTRL
jgi:hypothetical protein